IPSEGAEAVKHTPDPEKLHSVPATPTREQGGGEQEPAVRWAGPAVVGAWGERDVIDALPGAVVVTDPAGRVVMWSASAERLFGWDRSEVVGHSLLGLVEPHGDLMVAAQNLTDGAAAGTLVERVLRRGDGSSISVMTATRPLVDRAGGVVA